MAEAQAVDPATLANEQQKELKQATNEVQQGAVEIKQDVQTLAEHLPEKIKRSLNTAKIALTDYSGQISPDAAGFLLKSHLWAAACLAGFFVAEMIGKRVFYAGLGGVFGNWSTIVTLGVVVPLLVLGAYVLFGIEPRKGNELILLASMLLGLVIGSVMSNRVLSFLAPPAAVLPLFVALSAYSAGMSPALATDRRLFVPVLVAPAAFVYVMFGAQQMCTSYVLYFGLLIVATVLDVQLKLDNSVAGTLATLHQEQWKTVLTLAVADVLAFRTLSDSIGGPIVTK